MYKLALILVVASIFGGLSLDCQANDKLITLDLKSVHNGGLFCAQVQTGSQKTKQSFELLVSTSYPLTWFPSTEMSPKRGYKIRRGAVYNKKRILARTIELDDEFMRFQVHNGTMQVGPISIDKQSFGVAYPNDGPTSLSFDGVLGLGQGQSEPKDVDYLFHNLYKQRYIDHLMFSLYINNTAAANNRLDNINDVGDRQLQAEGALVLGGVDSKYYTGEIHYANLYNNADWFHDQINWLNLSNIHLDWSRLDSKERTTHISRLGRIEVEMTPTQLLLESGYVLFIGPNEILDYIHEAFLGADKIIQDEFYVFKDCRLDNKPDIVFTLRDGVDVAITPEDYVIEHQLDDRQICLSAFKPSEEKIWIFGMKFLRKHYTVFDYENYRVGFAKPT